MLRRCCFVFSATSSPVKASDRPSAHLNTDSNLKKSQRSAARCFRGGSAVCSQQKALGGQPRAFRSGRAREMGAQAGAAVSSVPAWIVRPLGGCVIPVQRMLTVDRCKGKSQQALALCSSPRPLPSGARSPAGSGSHPPAVLWRSTGPHSSHRGPPSCSHQGNGPRPAAALQPTWEPRSAPRGIAQARPSSRDMA
jgi:hypothetical protein